MRLQRSGYPKLPSNSSHTMSVSLRLFDWHWNKMDVAILLLQYKNEMFSSFFWHRKDTIIFDEIPQCSTITWNICTHTRSRDIYTHRYTATHANIKSCILHNKLATIQFFFSLWLQKGVGGGGVITGIGPMGWTRNLWKRWCDVTDPFTVETATEGKRRRLGSRCPPPGATDSIPLGWSIQDRHHVVPVNTLTNKELVN